jgi:diguanylate cyclase (GGDEF)-like protein
VSKLSEFTLSITIAIGIALVANLLRFNVSAFFNKVTLLTASLLLVEIFVYIHGSEPLPWMLLFFIGITGYSFRWRGGLIAAGCAVVILALQTSEPLFPAVFSYLIIGLGTGVVSQYLLEKKRNHHKWIHMLVEQSKHLQVFREVSTTMQRTLQQDLLLKVILTSVTAGHGLGFNRAMIFLFTSESRSLKGIVGVGPMDVQKGYEVWEKITEDKLKLQDLIEHNFDSNFTDPELNDILQTLELPFNEHDIFGKSLTSQKPVIVEQIDRTDRSQALIHDLFRAEQFAVIPLINQGKNIGILLIDNIVNKRAITVMDTESILPLANQAAIALDHASLYEQIEEMALKDGLTGLLNQRAFQTILSEHFPHADNQQIPLSLIIFDIDFFKVFNDRNGHLLGNEVLMKLGSVISGALRPKDYSFRFGGEEFVILLPETSLEEAENTAEMIREIVESTAFPGEETQPCGTLTVSVGAACTDHPSIVSKNDLIDAADKALYQAKNSGKNTVVSYKEGVCIE